MASELGRPLQRLSAPLQPPYRRQAHRCHAEETLKGSIAAGSLVCRRIAAHSSLLSKVKHGAQRIIRFATGESARRSQVDATALTERRVAYQGKEGTRQAGAMESARARVRLLATEAVLAGYIAEHGALPPRIAALLGRPASADL